MGNIEEIEYNKRAIFESKIIKNENGKPDIENVIDIKLDSYKTIFNHFLNKNENITIYCDSCSEKYVDEDTTTALNIGKIIEIKDDYIVFKRFDGVGKWYPEIKYIIVIFQKFCLGIGILELCQSILIIEKGCWYDK